MTSRCGRASVTSEAVVRSNFEFALSGLQASCLRQQENDCRVESWIFGPSGEACHRLTTSGLDSAFQSLPVGDGRVLMFTNDVELHDVLLWDPRAQAHMVSTIGQVRGLGGYLLPSPAPGQLGFLVAREDTHRSAIWRIADTPPSLRRLAELPGACSGGVWLDDNAEHLVLDCAAPDGTCDGTLVDLKQGTFRPVFSVSSTSNDRVVGFSPRSKILVVQTNATGSNRLGWTVLGGDNALKFPETLHQGGLRHAVVAMSETGEQALVTRQDGTRSALLTYAFRDDSVVDVVTPPGTITGPASWNGSTIRVPFSAPAQPGTLLTLTASGSPRKLPVTEPEAPHGWADADLVELDGAAGPVESIVYGGSGWFRQPHLVLALHGGPISAWRWEFSQLFQDFAAAGIAVVAPNYTGSTGYGYEHVSATISAWGGPDLDDVLALARTLSECRAGLPRPVIWGVSYGAFLALLAAASAPRLWSACVALAPFLSGPRLHAASSSAVANRLARLGALASINDELGVRDVLRLCPSLSVPLLLMHGADDDVIPVEQSRMLYRRLRELGKEAVFYREITGGHDDLVSTPSRAIRDLIATFCRSSGIAVGPTPRPGVVRTGGGESCGRWPVLAEHE